MDGHRKTQKKPRDSQKSKVAMLLKEPQILNFDSWSAYEAFLSKPSMCFVQAVVTRCKLNLIGFHTSRERLFVDCRHDK